MTRLAHSGHSRLCVPKTSSGDEFGSPALCRVAWRCFWRLGDAAIRKTWEMTARTGLSESPLVLTGVYPLVWHGCQNHLEQYQGFVSGSNPATPTSFSEVPALNRHQYRHRYDLYISRHAHSRKLLCLERIVEWQCPCQSENVASRISTPPRRAPSPS
jgi:hypothetical protein